MDNDRSPSLNNNNNAPAEPFQPWGCAAYVAVTVAIFVLLRVLWGS
ncbi:MAG TPA: hypothetical protein PKC18_12045 [Lacipirellulaceae bacterium]|nr:hypothetical protein [Lacipirellulaceae bacterium]